MAARKPRTVAYRRQREGRTDYRKRLRLLRSGKPRLVVRVTGSRIIAQLIGFSPAGDKVILGTDSTVLRKFGWNAAGKNLPAAYLTGLLLGTRAMQQGYAAAVLDTGFREGLAGGRIFAALKGAVDAGMDIPHGENIFPSEERLQGKYLGKDLKSDSAGAIAAEFQSVRMAILNSLKDTKKTKGQK